MELNWKAEKLSRRHYAGCSSTTVCVAEKVAYFEFQAEAARTYLPSYVAARSGEGGGVFADSDILSKLEIELKSN